MADIFDQVAPAPTPGTGGDVFDQVGSASKPKDVFDTVAPAQQSPPPSIGDVLDKEMLGRIQQQMDPQRGKTQPLPTGGVPITMEEEMQMREDQDRVVPKIPKISDSFINSQWKGAQAGLGIDNAVIGAVNGMGTMTNAVLGTAAAVTAPVSVPAALAIHGAFSLYMAHQTGKAAMEAKKVIEDPNATVAQKAEAVGATGISFAMTVLGAKGMDEMGGDKVSPAQREAAKSWLRDFSEQSKPKDPELKPGIKINGGVTPGQVGDTHADITSRAAKVDDVDTVVAAADDANHVSVDQNGNVLNREEGGKFADENKLRPESDAGKPLQSQHLIQPKAGETNEKENAQGQEKTNDEKGDEVTPPAAPGPRNMGPGAANIEEIPQAKKVSIANAQVDEVRKARGDLPLMEPARKAMGATWDEAMQQIEKDPEKGADLVDAVRTGKVKAVNATDEAVMAHELIRVRNERDAEAERSTDPNATDEERAEANAKWQAHESRVNEVEQAVQDIGTTSARALQFRQVVLRDDYTQAALERKLRMAKGGQPLTPEESIHIKQQAEDIKTAQDAADTAQVKATEKGHTDAADSTVKDLQKEAKKVGKKKGTPTPEEQQAKLVKQMTAAAKEGATAQDSGNLINRLALQFVRSGITGREPLIDAVHGAIKDIFPGLEREQTRDAISGYGDFRPLDKEPAKVTLRGLKGEMQQLGKIDDMMKRQSAPKKTGMERRTPTDEERRLTKKVNDLKKAGGYNVTDPATQLRSALDAVKTRLKNQLKDFALRMETGEKPAKKSGVPYDDEAEKLKALVDRVRQTITDIEGKPEMTDEQRVKVAQSALEKQIEDYNRRIKEKDFTGMDRTSKTPPSQLLDALRARRDAIKEEFAHLRDADESFQADKRTKQNASAMESTQKQIEDLSKRIDEGDLEAKQNPKKPVSPELEDARSLRDLLSKQLRAMQDELKPKKTPEEIALQAYKSRTANRIADLQDRLARGDIAPRPRKTLTLDPEAQKLQAQANALKDQVDTERIKQQQANRTKAEVYQDTFVKWRRAFVLSHPGIVAKLASAATLRMISMPLEDIIGTGLSKIPGVRDISSRAPIEGGGLNPTAFGKSVASMFTKGLADSWSDLKTGKSDLDRLYGHKDVMPREAIDFFGSIHAALKAPVKRAAFEYAFAKQVDWAGRNGVDVTDPLAQSQMAMRAYEHANRQIFMGTNLATRWFNAGIRSLEQPPKGETHPSPGAKFAASAIKTALPIRGVPTNIAGEVMEYTFGGITGSVKAAKALRTGVENLKPEEADTIMRLLKKGSVGGAMMALGWYGYKDVSGYYQKGDKPKAGELKPGEVRINGYTVPKNLFHGAIQGPLMIGATARRVAEKVVHGKQQGTPEGIYQAVQGPMKELPFVFMGEEVSRASGSLAGLGDVIGNMAVPGLVSDVAKNMDQRDGQTVKRTPQSFGEALMLQIPKLRNEVPKASSSRPSSTGPKLPRIPSIPKT